MKKIPGLGLAAVGGLALALGVPALSAVGQDSPPVGQDSPPRPAVDVELGRQATILAEGAGVLVPVFVNCVGGDPRFGTSNLTVSVTQRVGDDLAKGTANRRVTCDGAPIVVVVPLAANTRPFRVGVAFVESRLSLSGPFPFIEDQDAEEVRFVAGPGTIPSTTIPSTTIPSTTTTRPTTTTTARPAPTSVPTTTSTP